VLFKWKRGMAKTLEAIKGAECLKESKGSVVRGWAHRSSSLR